MKTKQLAIELVILIIFSFLLWPGFIHATPTLTLEIEGGFYDPVTETWMTHDSSFTLKLIAGGSLDSGSDDDDNESDDSESHGNRRHSSISDNRESSERGSHDSRSRDDDRDSSESHGSRSRDDDDDDSDDDESSGSGGSHRNKLFGVNLIIAAPGTESGIETGTVSLDGGATTIPLSAFNWGTPQFNLAQVGTKEYPSHGIYPPWFALDSVNGGEEFGLPQTFTYDVVVTGFSWVHFDAFGYYQTACGRRGGKIHSVFVPPSHDAEYAAEAMAVPEPSTFALITLGFLGFIFLKTPAFKKKLKNNS